MPRAFLALAALASGCGNAPRTHTPVASTQAAPICRFGGEWTVGSLRTLVGGYVFADVHDGIAEAQLDRAEGPLRIHVAVAQDGWHLSGRLDPENEDVLRVRAPTQLADTVVLSAGAPATLLDARDDRGGEVLLGISTYARRAGDGFRFLTPVQRWLPCEAAGLSFALRDEGREAQERLAIGLPADPPMVQIARATTARLAAAPGGAPFLEITPREYPEPVLLVGEQAGESRILVHHWDGTMILGWVASASLSPLADGSGGLGLIGGIGGPQRLDVCTSRERLTLFASNAGSVVEPIGWLDPGTPFVRLASGADGTFSLRPHPQSGAHIRGENVLWGARSESPLVCAVEQYDPSAGLAALRGAPAATLTIRATVTAVRGVDGLAVGDTCGFDVEHFPLQAFPCHAAISCGDRVVFGHSATNGLFACELGVGEAPFVRGRDEHTSASSGDPAMTIDSTAGTLEIDDDASGPLGAIHLEARIDAVEQAP